MVRKNEKAKAVVYGLKKTFPEYTHKQSEMAEQFIDAHTDVLSEDDKAFARRVFERTGIESCSTTLPLKKCFRKMSRGDFSVHIREELNKMAVRVAEAAIGEWGGDRGDITHVLWGTMTVAVDANTTDAVIATSLKLSPFVQRLSVQQMGCYTGFRLLGLATALAQENPNNRILVVSCDIGSCFGLQLPIPCDATGKSKRTMLRDAIISCALFRDAGSACIVAADGNKSGKGMAEIITHDSMLVPNSKEYLEIVDGKRDGEIMCHVGKEIPNAIASNIDTALRHARHQAMKSDYTLKCKDQGTRKTQELPAAKDITFMLHPGGPKILREVTKKLGLTDAHVATSWEYLKNHGNTMGASNLGVFHHGLTRAEAPFEPCSDVICLVGFGPGLGIETVFARRLVARNQ